MHKSIIKGISLTIALFSLSCGVSVFTACSCEKPFIVDIIEQKTEKTATPAPTAEPVPAPTPASTPEPISTKRPKPDKKQKPGPEFEPMPNTETSPSPEVPQEPRYSYITVDNGEVFFGDMVLVNYKNEYKCIDRVYDGLISLKEHASDYLMLERDDAKLLAEPLYALDEFAAAFFEQSGSKFFVTGAFRTLEYQEEVYAQYVKDYGEEMAKIYVADPGKSEHHIGFAVDLSSINENGERVKLMEQASFSWITKHCTDFGFIMRYPIGSERITHVAYEPWHFRYLGKLHAKSCEALKMLYEEYIEHLKLYSIESDMLHIDISSGKAAVGIAHIDAIPETGSLVYFVKASDGASTDIPLPFGCDDYSISGNNQDGFIVTIRP